MAIMTLYLSARDKELGASGIDTIANYALVTHEHFGLPKGEMVVCSIMLGIPNTTDSINQFRTEIRRAKENTDED